MVLALLAACTGAQGPAGMAGAGIQPEMLELFQGMAVTATYLDESMAIEAGYVATEDCVASPVGAMGMHYMNVGLLPDGDIDPSQPQVLMYVPSETGPKLAGFEYFMPLGPPGSPIPDPAPPLHRWPGIPLTDPWRATTRICHPTTTCIFGRGWQTQTVCSKISTRLFLAETS